MSVISSINSTLTAASIGAPVVTSVAYITEGEKPHPDRVKKVMTTTASLSISSATTWGITKMEERRVINTYSYVESLSDEELAALTTMIDEKEDTIENQKIKML